MVKLILSLYTKYLYEANAIRMSQIGFKTEELRIS
jgi:hypothetical protein